MTSFTLPWRFQALRKCADSMRGALSFGGAIAATDFFSVEVLTRARLIRYFVLFVIDLESQRVEIANITHQPHGQLLEQLARNLTDPIDGFLRKHRYLIHDRDPLFTQNFASILRGADVNVVKLPPRSPNLNAFAERFVGSIRRECLDHIIPLGEQHLRLVVREFVEHHNAERHHQGLDNRLIGPGPIPENDNGAIQRKRRLGGLLNFYHRRAAGFTSFEFSDTTRRPRCAPSARLCTAGAVPSSTTGQVVRPTHASRASTTRPSSSNDEPTALRF